MSETNNLLQDVGLVCLGDQVQTAKKNYTSVGLYERTHFFFVNNS